MKSATGAPAPCGDRGPRRERDCPAAQTSMSSRALPEGGLFVFVRQKADASNAGERPVCGHGVRHHGSNQSRDLANLLLGFVSEKL